MLTQLAAATAANGTSLGNNPVEFYYCTVQDSIIWDGHSFYLAVSNS